MQRIPLQPFLHQPPVLLRNWAQFPEYLNLLRMEEARKLLAQTDFPITEIALKTGFSSSSYFSSLFRRMNGMSPSTYRNLRTLSPKEK